MLCRLQMQPLMLFNEIVKDPEKFNKLPDDVRNQITASEPKTLESGTTSGKMDKRPNVTITQFRETIAEQSNEISTCLKRLSKLEILQE